MNCSWLTDAYDSSERCRVSLEFLVVLFQVESGIDSLRPLLISATRPASERRAYVATEPAAKTWQKPGHGRRRPRHLCGFFPEEAALRPR